MFEDTVRVVKDVRNTLRERGLSSKQVRLHTEFHSGRSNIHITIKMFGVSRRALEVIVAPYESETCSFDVNYKGGLFDESAKSVVLPKEGDAAIVAPGLFCRRYWDEFRFFRLKGGEEDHFASAWRDEGARCLWASLQMETELRLSIVDPDVGKHQSFAIKTYEAWQNYQGDPARTQAFEARFVAAMNVWVEQLKLAGE